MCPAGAWGSGTHNQEEEALLEHSDRRIGALLSRFNDAQPHFARRTLPLLVGAALVAGSSAWPLRGSARQAKTVSSYYLGNVVGMTREPIAHAEGVRMRDLYPGIDLVVHGGQSELEYDFVVAPGADPAQIAYDLSHAQSARVDRNGDL